MNNQYYNLTNVSKKLFGENTELLPSVTELFEIEMANMEHDVLNEDELVERSAFFKIINGKPTKHFSMYSRQLKAVYQNRSAITKAYFENGQFSTGYATHSLFPYRGKFHPQLIKGLLNIIGIKKGETILDPMCGSGTANIEASLMGINSFAVDVSPFCQFMTKTKYESLILKRELLNKIITNGKKLFKYFDVNDIWDKLKKIKNNERIKIYNLILLAFLDSMGYSRRVIKATHAELFEKVLHRYINTVVDILDNPHFEKDYLGRVEVLSKSNAVSMELKDNSIDGIITSPPYSFAIDYLANDQCQLEYFGYNLDELRLNMIGLKGKNKKERLDMYFDDMEKVCMEVHRVLKKDKSFVMIIGSNTNQTGGIRLEQTIINSCERAGLHLVRDILKPIKGMRNTMKEEHVLFFEKI